MNGGSGDVNAQPDSGQTALALDATGDARGVRELDPLDGPAEHEFPRPQLPAVDAVERSGMSSDESVGVVVWTERVNDVFGFTAGDPLPRPQLGVQREVESRWRPPPRVFGERGDADQAATD